MEELILCMIITCFLFLYDLTTSCRYIPIKRFDYFFNSYFLIYIFYNLLVDCNILILFLTSNSHCSIITEVANHVFIEYQIVLINRISFKQKILTTEVQAKV